MPYFAYGVNSRSPRRSPHRSPPAHVPLWTLGHRTPSGSLDTQTGHPLGSVLYIYFYYYTKQTGWVSCPMSTVYPCPPLSTPVQCPPYTDCPPCLDSPSVHLDSDVHVSTLSPGGSQIPSAHRRCIQNRASSSGGGGGRGGGRSAQSHHSARSAQPCALVV